MTIPFREKGDQSVSQVNGLLRWMYLYNNCEEYSGHPVKVCVIEERPELDLKAVESNVVALPDQQHLLVSNPNECDHNPFWMANCAIRLYQDPEYHKAIIYCLPHIIPEHDAIEACVEILSSTFNTSVIKPWTRRFDQMSTLSGIAINKLHIPEKDHPIIGVMTEKAYEKILRNAYGIDFEIWPQTLSNPEIGLSPNIFAISSKEYRNIGGFPEQWAGASEISCEPFDEYLINHAKGVASLAKGIIDLGKTYFNQNTLNIIAEPPAGGRHAAGKLAKYLPAT